MPNSISLATKYVPVLDEVFKMESKTSILESSNVFVREGSTANSVLIAKRTLQGLGDYSKTSGYPSGSVTLAWETHTFSQDRATSFQVDRMDDIETAGVAFAGLAGEFIRLHVAPELDSYRFAKGYSLAGTKVQSATPTAAGCYDEIDTALNTMFNAEVPETGRVMFVSYPYYNLMKQSSDVSRFSNVNMANGTIDRRIETFDGMPIIKVPTGRFYSAYTFNTGSSTFGYTPTAGAHNINFMIIHQNAMLPVVKTTIPKIFSPDENQSADAWKFQYRIYHDCFVPDNKTDGIYVNYQY